MVFSLCLYPLHHTTYGIEIIKGKRPPEVPSKKVVSFCKIVTLIPTQLYRFTVTAQKIIMQMTDEEGNGAILVGTVLKGQPAFFFM